MTNDDAIKVTNNNNEEKDYTLLAVLNIDDKQYIVYKDLNNRSINENLLASRIDVFSNSMKLYPLTDNEWNTVSNEYMKIINE